MTHIDKLDSWNMIRKEERVADLGQGWKATLTLDRDNQTETLVLTHYRQNGITLPTVAVDALRVILTSAAQLE